jgi:hypothetical protein
MAAKSQKRSFKMRQLLTHYEQVVPTRGRDFERPPRHLLPTHVLEVG